MKKRVMIINGDVEIPAIIWGEPSKKVAIAVHGNMSNKEDTVVTFFAAKAVEKRIQVISFDLPKHGERLNNDYQCTPENCISDLRKIYEFAYSEGSEISIFGCSIGAYFSLLAYCKHEIKQSLFISPVVNMERILKNMMEGFNISEELLKSEKKIKLPIGETLDWDYYTFVCQNPIDFEWNTPIDILYGLKDNICGKEDIEDFAKKNNAVIKIDDDGEHYYHTNEHLETINNWLLEALIE